jgi:hypothetical protein
MFGHRRRLRDPLAVAAGTVLFVGVKPLDGFSYPDILQFGYMALWSIASAVAQASRWHTHFTGWSWPR